MLQKQNNNLVISEINQIAEVMVKSGYFPDVKSLAQAAVKIIAGREFGLTPFESMQCLYIINGKPSLSGHTWANKIKSSIKYDYNVKEWNETKCTLEFVEKPNKILGQNTFTLEDAKRAQLIGKGGQMWEKYPKQMLFNRCLTAGARIYTPDVLNATLSIYTPDELSDDKITIIQAETGEIIENNNSEQEAEDCLAKTLIKIDEQETMEGVDKLCKEFKEKYGNDRIRLAKVVNAFKNKQQQLTIKSEDVPQ